MANSQTITDPIAVNRDTVNNIGVSANDMRWGVGSLSAPSVSTSVGHRSGVFPGRTTGSGYSDDCQVFSAAAAMGVTVQPGHFAVERSGYGVFLAAVTGGITVTHADSNPSLPRLDYVVIRTRDPGIDTGVTETAKVVILQGSPAASPTAPSAQMTSGDLLLAQVLIRAGTSSVIATDITDRRSWVVARGGITPRRLGDTSQGSYEGEYADDTVSNMLMRWSGTTWEPVASPAVWTQWSPPILCFGTGAVSLGTGAQFIGRYQLIGKRLDFNYFWKWGTKPYNTGSGAIYTRLPTHPVTGAQLYGVGYSQWVMAHLWVNDAYVGDFAGQALVRANTNRIEPYFFINAANNSNIAPYKIATTAGVTNGSSSVPNIFNPNGFPQGGDLQITGSCEVTF